MDGTVPKPAPANASRHGVSLRGLKRTYGVDRRRLVTVLHGTLQSERAPDGELTVALIGDRAMRRMNRDYRGVDRTTDVLSFSYVDEPYAGGVLGEIYVSPTVAARQADDAGCPLGEEIARLIVHGTLHILGYRHDTIAEDRRMRSRQDRYVDRYYLEKAS